VTNGDLLLSRILYIGMAVSGSIALTTPLLGWDWKSGATMGALTLGYFVTLRITRTRRDLAIQLNLLLTWIALTCCDDGFRGNGGSWLYWTPFTLETLLLMAPGWNRRLWLATIPLSLFLVNLTPWTPHFNGASDPFFGLFHKAFDFAGALVVSFWCVRFVQMQHQTVLSERDLALERWKQAAAVKSEFLSHMSHEFRTPLNAISGFTDLLLQTKGRSAEDQENLNAIRISSELLVHLVNDVLDLSRMESGHLSLAALPFLPTDCLAQAHTTLRGQAREKNLDFRCRCEGEIPVLIGDRVRWSQILLNLISNAIKYTESGSVEALLSWSLLPGEEAGRMTLSVRDTGPGIPADRLESIFSRFERIDERDPSGTKGSGLGLAIARNLARNMGGDIEVESRLGQGSLFRTHVVMPVANAPLPPPAPATALPDLQGMHVLLCDDTPMNVRLASLVLDRLNATYDIAEDGGQAMERLHRRAYDLILLDLHMPVLDGYQVAQAIRDVQGVVVNKQVPILALTADASEETRQRTLAAGMDDFLAKPFRPSELAHRARTLGMG